MSPHFIQQGKGIPFVFQHGLGANVSQVQKLFGDFAGLQLISMDCPGHGLSVYPMHRNPSFDYYADQVIQLVDRLSIDQFVLGGLSMGAGIALNLALRFPERVSALVLLRPAWLDQPHPINLQLLVEAARHMSKPNGEEAFKQNEVFQTIQKSLPTAAASILGVFDPNQQPRIGEVLKHMINDRPIDDLAAVQHLKIPTLIIANQDDPLHPYQIAEVIHQYLPNSTLQSVISRYVDNDKHRIAVRMFVKAFISQL